MRRKFLFLIFMMSIFNAYAPDSETYQHEDDSKQEPTIEDFQELNRLYDEVKNLFPNKSELYQFLSIDYVEKFDKSHFLPYYEYKKNLISLTQKDFTKIDESVFGILQEPILLALGFKLLGDEKNYKSPFISCLKEKIEINNGKEGLYCLKSDNKFISSDLSGNIIQEISKDEINQKCEDLSFFFRSFFFNKNKFFNIKKIISNIQDDVLSKNALIAKEALNKSSIMYGTINDLTMKFIIENAPNDLTEDEKDKIIVLLCNENYSILKYFNANKQDFKDGPIKELFESAKKKFDENEHAINKFLDPAEEKNKGSFFNEIDFRITTTTTIDPKLALQALKLIEEECNGDIYSKKFEQKIYVPFFYYFANNFELNDDGDFISNVHDCKCKISKDDSFSYKVIKILNSDDDEEVYDVFDRIKSNIERSYSELFLSNLFEYNHLRIKDRIKEFEKNILCRMELFSDEKRKLFFPDILELYEAFQKSKINNVPNLTLKTMAKQYFKKFLTRTEDSSATFKEVFSLILEPNDVVFSNKNEIIVTPNDVVSSNKNEIIVTPNDVVSSVITKKDEQKLPNNNIFDLLAIELGVEKKLGIFLFKGGAVFNRNFKMSGTISAICLTNFSKEVQIGIGASGLLKSSKPEFFFTIFVSQEIIFAQFSLNNKKAAFSVGFKKSFVNFGVGVY